MPQNVVDQVARDGVRDVDHGLRSHIQTTDIKLENLNTTVTTNHTVVTEKIDQIRSAIIWAGGVIVSVLLSVLGWSVLQQISANEAQKRDLQEQLKVMQESVRQQPPTASILVTPTPSPTGAAETGTAAFSR